MGKIPESSIQEVLDKTNFLSVFQEKVRLSKKGNKWWGLCPFHTEKTPSFSVDSERGLFYCFGCQKGGSVIDFLMETEKMSFLEAVTELAQKAHVALPVESSYSGKEDSEKDQLYSLYDKLANAFHWLLTEHASGGEALTILHRRGISDGLIETFRLGYAPADKTWLFGFLRSKGFSEEFLARTGLFSSRTRNYPLFADRIIFPISDSKGRVIAFGGRLISGDGPKYINSPDTAIFRKQENLFAFDKALPAIKEKNTVLVCEGYMDALSFHAAGTTHAVAPLGTAFTTRQAQLLKRRADRVLLCFDSDEAGKKAAERACSIAAGAGMEVFVISMTTGKDASEILEKFGADSLKKVSECIINGGDFLIHRAEELFDIGTMEGKAKASLFFYPYLDALDSEVKRNAFFDIVARKLGVNSSSLQTDYYKAKTFGGSQVRHVETANAAHSSGGFAGARTADLFFMTAVVLSPESFEKVGKAIGPNDLDDTRARDLFFALEEASDHGAKETASILSFSNDEAAKSFVLAVAASGELDQEIEKVIDDGIRTIRMRSLERARIRLISEIGNASRESGEKDLLQQNGVPVGQKNPLVELLKRKMHLDSELARLKGEVDE